MQPLAVLFRRPAELQEGGEERARAQSPPEESRCPDCAAVAEEGRKEARAPQGPPYHPCRGARGHIQKGREGAAILMGG